MKIFSVLAEFVLWELSIVSSLSLYSILVQYACNDRACLTLGPSYEKFLKFKDQGLLGSNNTSGTFE